MGQLNDQIKEIMPYFDRISNASGKAKEPEILRCFENGTAKEALIYLLDPMMVFHLQEASLKKKMVAPLFDLCEDITIYNDLFGLCEYLASKKALTDNDIRIVQNTMKYAVGSAEEREFLSAFITKSLRLGVTAKTVNKVVGYEAVPEFTCMLANKFFEHQKAVEGKHFFLTEKFDGIRCLAICRRGQEPRLYSRQGQEITGLVDIEADLKRMMKRIERGFVLDGELLVTDRDSIPSKEQYKQTVKIVRSDSPEKQGVTYHVFDYIDMLDWVTKESTEDYMSRRHMLSCFFKDTDHVCVVPVLYSGTDTNAIYEHLDRQRSLHHEGVMINLADATYDFKRTNSLLKVKVMQDCDLEIIGMEEGKGKFAGTLGALIVDYKGAPLGVGSGLSDEWRRTFWANQAKYIGRVVTVQYFEETNDKDGKLSIRFPVFKDLCDEGKEVSYN